MGKKKFHWTIYRMSLGLLLPKAADKLPNLPNHTSIIQPLSPGEWDTYFNNINNNNNNNQWY